MSKTVTGLPQNVMDFGAQRKKRLCDFNALSLKVSSFMKFYIQEDKNCIHLIEQYKKSYSLP